MDTAALSDAGINCESGVKRLLGDSQLYESVLRIFLEDTTMEQARESFEAGDMTMLRRYAHILKGACGNIDLLDAFSACCELLSTMDRNHTDEQLSERFLSLERAYVRAKDGIRRAMA